jgi:hypothetical protein
MLLGYPSESVGQKVVAAADNKDVGVDVILKVNFEEEEKLSKIFTPSMYVTYSKASAKKIIEKEMDHLGLARITIEPALFRSRDIKDYVARLSGYDNEVQEVIKRGGNVILLTGKTPRWLASNTSGRYIGDGWTIYAASPPKDYNKWADIVYHTVNHFNNELGLDVFYEIWSEPDNPNKHFWLGTQKQFLELYKYTVLGAKRADPKAKVVAPSVLCWYGSIDKSVEQRQKPDLKRSLIYDLIRFSATTPLPELDMERIPLDFISYHLYGYHPSDIYVSVNQTKIWLKEFNYLNTQIIISEGNCPELDSLKNAVCYLATLKSMDKNRIYWHTFLGLQDVHSAQEWNFLGEFHQEFGMFTRDFAIKKPVYNAFFMLSMLGKTRIKTSLVNSQTIDAIATKDTDRVSILVWNYTLPPIKAAHRYLKSLGYSKDSFKKLNISKRDIKKFIKEGKFPQNLSLPKDVKNDLNEARRLFFEQNKLIESSRVVRLIIDKLPYYSFKYERYLIDQTHSNSHYYYKKAKAEGKTEEQAIKEARAHQHLEKVEEKFLKKNDNIPPIPFGPYSVSLIILQKEL